ncbi:IS6 family transposase [Mesorhizobium sp. M1156]|uniref:IS6 family transposase n=1 Tax=Mesorhizobium sp. M1156 TaxID=2957064 RepID=UPI003334CE54
MSAPTYKNHRDPIEIVARAVWLYFRFDLSLRYVEEMLLDRGIVVYYETIRRWCRKHGPGYARRIRCKAPTKDDVWHLDEVVVRINGQKCWFLRAVDQDGYVLDEIVQTRRNTRAARRLLTRLLKKQGLRSHPVNSSPEAYGPAAKTYDHRQIALLRGGQREVMPNVEHRSHKGLNNRAENSHLPFRKQERTRQGAWRADFCAPARR